MCLADHLPGDLPQAAPILRAALPPPLDSEVLGWILERTVFDLLTRRLDHRWRVRSQELNATLRESIAGARVVKAFNQEEQEKTRFSERNRDCLTEFNRIHWNWTRFWPGLMLGVVVRPALFTRISIPPRRVLMSAKAPATDSKSVTSNTMDSTWRS